MSGVVGFECHKLGLQNVNNFPINYRGGVLWALHFLIHAVESTFPIYRRYPNIHSTHQKDFKCGGKEIE